MHTEQYWRERPLDDKGDWATDKTWLDSYWESRNHPHREAILNEVSWLEPNSLIEIGCNVGPNLHRINERYPDIELMGFDPSEDAIERAKENVPYADLWVGSILEEHGFSRADVALADASLMYVPPHQILTAMAKVAEMADNIIIVDRFSISTLGLPHGTIWQRNYEQILTGFGYNVDARKLKDEEWPTSQGWKDNGFIWTAKR